ncbi:hypothetical protein SLEP1_g22704 [Rubroshorea leprosula]|uniref:RNase H type-1 domain-containing protein n=1 Tax=Rubroshorea leprosula TaxID=152421 RepID=A0AAV5JG22_9ROSI|nr:hypothetical protein SLEP1_g22704 [Rubroshorea leprosula]
MGVDIVDNRLEDETRANPVEDVEEVQIDDRDQSRKTQIGTRLNSKERAKLIAFLQANKDVFAWTLADMPGIPTSIGRNLEVYVDDIVVKSLKAKDHLADLDETFNNLKQNRMRLNPAKCIFGVESGKFLGFMVSQKGIEVNLEKIKAIAKMEPPKSVKDIQRLIGKKKFEWNQECQAAFDELKYYLSSPPLLTKAMDGEILYLYLSISDEAISSVLSTVCHSNPNLEPSDWTLYVNGASSNKGSRAGALLIGPKGYRSDHALKFNFDATNNMAEYEALLLGLQLTLELKVTAIRVYSESQLVVNQVNSICEVIDLVMMKYVALMVELK